MALTGLPKGPPRPAANVYARPLIVVPPQIQPAGLMQPGHPPLNIPPRRDNIDGDFQELMEFILPAFDHLVRPNPPYMGGEMPEKPLLHPEYAQSIYDVVAQIQEHHRRPELLSFPECGDLFYTHLDD